jgi:protein-disulfide isomerase
MKRAAKLSFPASMKIRTGFVLCLILAAASPVLAQPLDLRSYLEQSFPLCPDGSVTVEQMQVAGPAGFVPYRVRFTSSVKNCGREKFALVSPATSQVIIADVFALPPDPQGPQARIAQISQRLLRTPVTVTVGTTALEDGLNEVVVTSKGKEGPFDIRGWLDASESFLIVGRRGKLTVDPRKSLVEALPSDAARRGKKDAAIRIVELSDFQCPTCKHAHDLLASLIETNLGRISYTRIDLPLFQGHDWSLDAALAARAIHRLAPKLYWQFVDHIFDNQMAITSAHLESFVKDFAENNDIDWKKVRAITKSPAERKVLIRQVERINDLGILATPTYIVNGREIFYGHEGTHLKQHLESLLKTAK